MANRRFEIDVEGEAVLVEMNKEGDDRYMVRMSIPGRLARIRIGYLLGARRHWCAEFFGAKRQTAHVSSATEACRMLADWACRQPAVASCLRH